MTTPQLRAALAAAGPGLALAAIVAGFAFFDWRLDGESTFLTARNLRATVAAALPVAVAALGMTAVIAAGGIDLSAGTMLALCAVVLAAALKAGLSPEAAVLLAVGCGAACGALNGALIAALGVVPFVVTLGTLGAFQGAAKIVAEETTVRPPRDSVPRWLGRLTSILPDSLVLGLPAGAWVLLGVGAGDGVHAAADRVRPAPVRGRVEREDGPAVRRGGRADEGRRVRPGRPADGGRGGDAVRHAERRQPDQRAGDGTEDHRRRRDRRGQPVRRAGRGCSGR